MKRVNESWMIDAVQERLDGWQRTGSVSYTHLDVYKRQEYLWPAEYDEEEDEMRYEEDEVFPDDLFYSFYYYSWHDVYKRQLPSWSRCSKEVWI